MSAKNRPSLLSLPKTYLTVDEVQRKFPELVQRRIVIEAAHVKKDALAHAISLKQTWDWQLEDAHWQLLKKEFPALAASPAATREERFKCLDKLDEALRLKVDQYARSQIIEEHPEWLIAALEKASAQHLTLDFRLKGGHFPLEGVEDRKTFISHLQKAPLASYTQDQENFYRINVLQASSQDEILSFAEVSRDGTLDELLDQRLEEAYPEVRKKDPVAFQKTDGEWKNYIEVRDLVGAQVYSDLLRAIERKSPVAKDSDASMDFYPKYRLYAYMQEAKVALQKNAQDPQWIKETKQNGDALSNQWLLTREKLDVKRSSSLFFDQENLFSLSEGSWSPLFHEKQGGLIFGRIAEAKKEVKDVSGKIAEGKQLLANDARRHLMKQMLASFKEKQAIHFFDSKEEDKR